MVQYTWIDTWADSVAESHLPWKFELLIWSISSAVFPFLANHFDLSGSESIFGISPGSLPSMHLLAEMDSSEEAYG